jgi:hypothetical protein
LSLSGLPTKSLHRFLTSLICVTYPTSINYWLLKTTWKIPQWFVKHSCLYILVTLSVWQRTQSNKQIARV